MKPSCWQSGWALAGLLVLCVGQAGWAQDRVAETVHNLAASGPGQFRSPSEQQVCIFCHAPHNTRGVRPLWNRELPSASYNIYQSSTLDARPGQPTGASKLCLSCHDGTIALGSVLSRSDRIRMSGGEFIPAGLANLGTDLSDDHPVSFYYSAGLVASDRQLASPQALPEEVRLDTSGQLQCTTCHDPHDNTFGDFLVMGSEFGRLCRTCHQMNGWGSGAHARAGVAVSGSALSDWPHATVAENACRSCHRSHAAGGHERLLIFEREEDNCLNCHNGQVARSDIRAEIEKPSSHDPRRYLGTHDPKETTSGMKGHVECTDCHNPHAASADIPQGGYQAIGATLLHVAGVTTGGAWIAEARYEYEVCLRCHGDAAVSVGQGVARQSQTSNLRLKFSRGNPSFHPLVVSSGSSDTVSLVPGLSRGSLIRCTDCHNNDAGRRAGGTGPDGPHGSNYDFLLERNYTVRDDTIESEFDYALCYKCHQRASILADQSFPLHRFHVEEGRAPCSACHDPHGVSRAVVSGSDHTHLINFDTQIVRPVGGVGNIEFRDLGRFEGTCTLTCHGRDHQAEAYGQLAEESATKKRVRSRRLFGR